MLISHEYRFIFLRTEKTAGSSLKSALLELHAKEGAPAARLGPGLEDGKRKRPAWAKYSPVDYGALKRNFPGLFGLHEHATARQVRAVLGPKVFDSYYKFTVERNPWDRQVSLYFHRSWKTGKKDTDFDRDMRSRLYRWTEYCRLNNWQIYSIDNQIVADKVMRFEGLDDDLAELADNLGFARPLKMPQLRADYRGARPHYSSFYSPATRQLVADWYAAEIEAFGYRFEMKGPEPLSPEPLAPDDASHTGRDHVDTR